MIPVGLLIDGIEFISQDIVDQHMPFAVPPDVQVQVVYVLPAEEYE